MDFANIKLALETAPVGFEQTYNSGTLDADELESVALHLLTLAAYLDGRSRMQGHRTAAEEACATRNRIRKALGYSVPSSFKSF